MPLRDECGKILKWYGIATDIEDRKRSEEALRRTEFYLAEAQRLTHTGSYAYQGRTNTYPYWSEEHFRIWGFDPRQAPPDAGTLLQRVHPEDRKMVRQRFIESLRERSDYTAEYRIMLPDGTLRYIEAIGHHVYRERGGPILIIGTHVDVTERKRAEEQHERLRQLEADLVHINRVSMMGELAASLTHEIKPMAAALINAKVCLRWLRHEEPNVAEGYEAAAGIIGDLTRAAEIIERVRCLYRRDTKQREPVDLNQTVREIIALLRDAANQHSIPIRTEFDVELPLITADRVQLQQVLMNLMLNGIEAMKDTGGELTVRSERSDDRLLISVSDTGVGVPAEKLDQIFTAFFTTKPQGTGMGLAISRSIVESHGGRLWVKPNPGRGATFQFALPISMRASSAASAA